MLKKISKKLDFGIEIIKECAEFIFKYRYYIAIVAFILCILFEISGSSIGMWNNFINSNVTKNGVLLGKSRAIRSDEWAVLTPMMFSQSFNGFKYFSEILRADTTDVFMVYALPVLNIMQIFRPFQLGFLFLGASRGLSFFWCGRLIVLFLTTIEFGMILTKKDKLLSFIMAVLVTLAPTMQWWFAVNGIAEIFIFGELALILLYKYMNDNNLKIRCLYLLGLVISAGGYLLVLYPSWQIPLFYVFLVIAIWIIIENRKKCKMNYKDIISIIVAIIIFGISMGYIFYQSMDTIKAVMNTVYPGSRDLTGGGEIKHYFSYIMNIFTPFKDVLLDTNTCEKAMMFGLFPLGIIMSVSIMIKEKKKDLPLILLLIVYLFLSIWCIFGFPKILAKITLLSRVQPKRAMLGVGFIDILLLIRCLAIREKEDKRVYSIIVSVILTVIMVVFSKLFNREYITIRMAAAMTIMCIYLFYFIFRYNSKYSKILFTCGIVFVMLMCGGTVNPIRRGVNVIYDSEIIKKAQEINEKNKGKWMVEELGFPIANYFMMAGVPIVNCTNTYPDMDRWKKIDINEEYEKIYNRYAHITMKLRSSDSEFEKKFELLGSDQFEVYLTPNELKELDIKYIFTINDLEKLNTEEYKFENIYELNGYKVYNFQMVQ